MTQPLALVCHERLLPGSRLADRLSELGYRVDVLSNYDKLVATAVAEKPLLVVLDLTCRSGQSEALIKALRAKPETEHTPLLAFGNLKNPEVQTGALAAGANLVASEDFILQQLPQLLNHIFDLN
jgi:DNA-binding response OmpR family regulator